MFLNTKKSHEQEKSLIKQVLHINENSFVKVIRLIFHSPDAFFAVIFVEEACIIIGDGDTACRCRILICHISCTLQKTQNLMSGQEKYETCAQRERGGGEEEEAEHTDRITGAETQ